MNYLEEIYPSQQTVEKANKLNHLANYLDLISRDLILTIDSRGKLSTRPYDKPSDFDFPIVDFPFLSSNIASGRSYGIQILQLIRYVQCCSNYDDSRCPQTCLVDCLLRSRLRNFMADIKISLTNTRGQSREW